MIKNPTYEAISFLVSDIFIFLITRQIRDIVKTYPNKEGFKVLISKCIWTDAEYNMIQCYVYYNHLTYNTLLHSVNLEYKF